MGGKSPDPKIFCKFYLAWETKIPYILKKFWAQKV